ncbi:MAG: hypothetical protein NDI61_12380 [Bdellovibrionaceae bacterium]|nr:hypothetical protein [Pseudobdellovibrionaceae bacterium]
MGRDAPSSASSVISISPRAFFLEAVNEALQHRKVKTLPQVRTYLVDLLEFHLTTENLFDVVDDSGRRSRETLAEMYLRASLAEPRMRMELLKKVGDKALYVSGFFGDSLQRKVVDVDYYAGMGGTAYATLSECVREAPAAQMFREFAKRFNEFMDVLTHISSHAFVQNEENILRLYENYARTGSDVARERLLEKGLIAVPMEGAAKKKQ